MTYIYAVVSVARVVSHRTTAGARNQAPKEMRAYRVKYKDRTYSLPSIA